jgi:hypothetical protein
MGTGIQESCEKWILATLVHLMDISGTTGLCAVNTPHEIILAFGLWHTWHGPWRIVGIHCYCTISCFCLPLAQAQRKATGEGEESVEGNPLENSIPQRTPCVPIHGGGQSWLSRNTQPVASPPEGRHSATQPKWGQGSLIMEALGYLSSYYVPGT